MDVKNIDGKRWDKIKVRSGVFIGSEKELKYLKRKIILFVISKFFYYFKYFFISGYHYNNNKWKIL